MKDGEEDYHKKHHMCANCIRQVTPIGLRSDNRITCPFCRGDTKRYRSPSPSPPHRGNSIRYPDIPGTSEMRLRWNNLLRFLSEPFCRK